MSFVAYQSKTMNQYQDFVGLFEEAIKQNWDRDALTDYEGITLQYHDVARKIEKLHILFESCPLRQKLRSVGCIIPCHIGLWRRSSAHPS